MGPASQGNDCHSSLLTLADMVSPVSHELRNVFNNIVLKAAILSQAVPEELRDQAADFRALAMRANEMLSFLDQYRQKIVAARQPLDLNAVVLEAVDRCQAAGSAVTKKTTPDLPPVWGNQADVRRLVELLVAAFQGPVQVLTDRSAAAVRLTVQDSGPLPRAEELESFFEPFGPPGASQSGLELAACQTIARRLKAAIRAENQIGRAHV